MQTSFGQAVPSANAVTLGVDLRRSGEALRAARQLDPTAIVSVPRRSRHLIEVARAYAQRNEPAAVVEMLDRSQRTALETISYSNNPKESRTIPRNPKVACCELGRYSGSRPHQVER
ncbi:hypothetical protein [Nocardia sp. NPDC060259]|uniref:hypothetical protein n=1 Tax=Nocardia sp. NPDC060259 TaxID=3347088 RepID=UPI00364698C4